MPTLLNPRREAFALALAQGQSAAQALKAAGYRSDRRNGTRMTSYDDISQRVAELQQEAAAWAAVTLDSLLAELEDKRRQAMALGQTAAAVAATREKGILTGLRVERSAADLRVNDPSRMSDAELGVIIAASLTDEELRAISARCNEEPAR